MKIRLLIILIVLNNISVLHANVNSQGDIQNQDQLAPSYNFSRENSFEVMELENNKNAKNEDKTAKSYKKIEYILKDSDSLFFREEQIERLNLVKDAVSAGIEVQANFDDEIESKQEQIAKVNVINFYLNSILYYSKDNWSIWINGSKINKESSNTDLELLTIDSKNVKFKWTTGYGKFVDTLTKIVDEGKIPQDIYIEITDNIAIVIFSLKPNQSFRLGSSLNIIEGK